MEEIICNLCDTKTKEKVVYKDDRFRVVMCERCSLVYLNPRLTSNEYKKYYNTGYQLSRHNLTEYNQSVDRLERRNSYKSHKEKYFDFFKDSLSQNTNLLEIGSGWGTLLKVIKDHKNCDVTGIEISVLASEVAQKHYGLKIHNCTFESYIKERKEEKFDFVILNHVFEHFLDPLLILKHIKSILTNTGKLFIVAPNIATPDEPLDRYFRVEHCYYFSPLTLKIMLERVGFSITEIDFNPSEMRIIAVADEVKDSGIANFEMLYSYRRVLNRIKKQERKYEILRVFKVFFETILPKRIAKLLRIWVVKILKKLRMIHI